MANERRMLFSVTEVTLSDGTKAMEMDWHPSLYPVLEELSPNGEITDKIINIAEELVVAENEDAVVL